jgi:hypothetical protein
VKGPVDGLVQLLRRAALHPHQLAKFFWAGNKGCLFLFCCGRLRLRLWRRLLLVGSILSRHCYCWCWCFVRHVNAVVVIHPIQHRLVVEQNRRHGNGEAYPKGMQDHLVLVSGIDALHFAVNERIICSNCGSSSSSISSLCLFCDNSPIIDHYFLSSLFRFHQSVVAPDGISWIVILIICRCHRTR